MEQALNKHKKNQVQYEYTTIFQLSQKSLEVKMEPTSD